MPSLTHLDQRPTSIQVDCVFTVNGGDIRDEEIARFRKAVCDAVAAVSEKSGITYGVTMKSSSISPKSFDAMLARRK